MLRTPCRLTQWSCVAMVVLGLLPWALLVGALVLKAIDSTSPLALSIAAWIVLLVPMWVAWFGAIAWRQRHETVVPAVIMAAPVLVITTLFMLIPNGAAAP